jgi:4-hydroxythreonine-4-phosphate dehydrogenase
MLPRLILTSGEPAGIGPDLCVAAVAHDWPCELIVAGDARLLAERARMLRSDARVEIYAPHSARRPHIRNVLRVLDMKAPAEVAAGRLEPANAPYVLAMLDAAVAGCLAHEFDGMVTAPVQKSVINEAGVPFSGHTEYLAERTGGAYPVMLLAVQRLRVALVTTHLPLSSVPAALTPERIARVARILHADLRAKFGIEQPRILVCGLNPHAGEAGHLGREEIEIIAPTLDALRAEGIDLIGPAPADTAFTPHMLEGMDAVLAMYHDQGLPVIKYAGFGSAVNVTLGLPIVRTSVDHGTALSLAGTGQADVGSLIAAIELAIELSAAAKSARTTLRTGAH